nr:HAMP domain-containing sensor histidine kinase [Adlercreutzia equolifaciens]
MALKSEQARVLRRRVLGGLIRNLLLFSGAFALACLAIETFMVPSIANWVADSTSSWRTLNSSEQFQQILTDQGLLDDANLFDLWVNEAVEGGYTNDAGTITEIQGEVNEMEDALAEYASMMADSPENAEAAAAYAKERAEKLGADVAVASGTNAAAIGDASTFIDDATALDAETDSAPADKTARAVPLLPYQTILTAEAIPADDASAAQAIAALRVSASLQELGLSLPEAQTFMPPETTVDAATRILVSAAVLGYDQPTLNDLLQSAFRQSQEQAYSAWLDLTSAEEARALGVSDENPVWQIQYGEDGVYRMRDVATYTFVKSFKLPLALLVFVAGWLAIILRALNRSLRYFDELSGAVGRLLADKDAPIELPADLSIARNELAVIRSQSLADERAAHAAEQRKNELVAYLAHDIRTPLTSVLGYLDLLRETTDLPRETLRKYADIAYSKAERLESLINEFFEITRYNLSAIPIERETVGVRLFCQQVAEAFFPEAAARNIRITVDAAGAGQFFIDPDKLARALGNVLRNAVAYADANSVIAIAARQDARTTTITVANRGREISDAHLETIFEKFYREDGARSSKKGGAGLGLAIAREIVVAHHGDIEAASERGVTVFTLRIPTQGEEIEGAAAAPRIPGATEGVQRPVAPVPPRTVRPASTRATPRRLPQRRAAGPPPVRIRSTPSANGRTRRAKVPLR